jgi:hypothetical protein
MIFKTDFFCTLVKHLYEKIDIFSYHNFILEFLKYSVSKNTPSHGETVKMKARPQWTTRMWVRRSERESAGHLPSPPLPSQSSLSCQFTGKGREREKRGEVGTAEVDEEELVSCGRPHPFPLLYSKNHQEAGMGQMGAGDGDAGGGGGHPHQYHHYQALLAAVQNPNQTLHPFSIPFPAG